MARTSGRDIIASAIDTQKLASLADTVANDGMQALLRVMKESDVPGGLGDSRAMRKMFRDQVLTNIMAHAVSLLQGAGNGK